MSGVGYTFLVFPIVFGLIWIAAVVYWIVVIVEVSKIPDMQFRAIGSEKVVWLLIVILGGIIGSLVWTFAKRDEVMRSARRDSAAAARLVSRGSHGNASLVGRLPVDRHPSFPSSDRVAGSA